MNRTNVMVVQEYIEQIYNRRRLESLPGFCSPEAVIHAPPYVGLGVNFDDTSGERLILTQIASDSPACGHLVPGDELVRVRSEEQTWETFGTLRKGLWARGPAGSEIAMTVRRHGNLVTLPLRLGQINKFDIRLSEWLMTVIPYLNQYWPDLRMDIREIFGAGDMVACYSINHGTSLEYNRSAIWSEMDLFRLLDGRIVEVWSVENTYDELTQLGYQVSEPVLETA